MKTGATFDSSFWVHAVYLDLIDFLLSDFELVCAKAVEKELGRDNPTSRRLQALVADRSIKQAAPKSATIKLYGDGERAAINLALERKLLLLIDDWRPYEAAQAAGVEVVNSLAYLVGLYEQKRITAERVLHALVKITRRGTLRPEWIQSAVRIVSEIRRKGEFS
jgi:predicted nucleic acid-binding protein